MKTYFFEPGQMFYEKPALFGGHFYYDRKIRLWTVIFYDQNGNLADSDYSDTKPKLKTRSVYR